METDRIKNAINLYEEGFTCSQAIFASFSDLFGIEKEIALRLSNGLGGGIARMQKTCGAFTSAVLLLGLKYGRVKADDKETQDKAYSFIREFHKNFIDKFGETECKKLLNFDISTQEGYIKAKESGLLKSLCPNFIRFTAEEMVKYLIE